MKIIIKEIEKRKGIVRANEIINFFDANSITSEHPSDDLRWSRQTVINTLKDACKQKKLERNPPLGHYGPKVTYEIPNIRKDLEKSEKDWEEYVVNVIDNIDDFLKLTNELPELNSEMIANILHKFISANRTLFNVTNTLDLSYTKRTNKDTWKIFNKMVSDRQTLLMKNIAKLEKKYGGIYRELMNKEIDNLEFILDDLENVFDSKKNQTDD